MYNKRMEKEYLVIGTIIGSFKLDGTLKVKSQTDIPFERYQVGNEIILKNKDGSLSTLIVEAFRKNGEIDFVKTKEITVKEIADSLKGCQLLVEKDRNDLEEGFYFFSDLEGCKVIDQNNKDVGLVIKVEEFPAQITLRVRKDEKDYFIPFIEPFIKSVDINKKEIHVELLEGMLWELKY